MSFFTGTPGMFKRMQGLPSDALSSAANYYKGLLGPDSQDFTAQAAPEMRRFRQQIIPDLAEQFAGYGSGGAIGGSGFANAAATAGADLAERLAALRSRLRESAASGLGQLAQQGTYYQEARPGFADLIGPGIGAGISAFGGPMLGALGGQAASWLVDRMSKPKNTLNMRPAGLYPMQGNFNPYDEEFR